MKGTAIVVRDVSNKQWFVEINEDHVVFEAYSKSDSIFNIKTKLTKAEAMDIISETFAWLEIDPHHYTLGMKKDRVIKDIIWFDDEDFYDYDYKVELYEGELYEEKFVFEECYFHTFIMAKEWSRGRDSANYTAKITRKEQVSFYSYNYNKSLKKVVNND